MQAQKFRTGRREFLKRSAGGIVSASTLSMLASHTAWAQWHHQGIIPSATLKRGYGPLKRMADQNAQEILALPEGFSYVTFSKTGQPMMDGAGLVPAIHDGMACFPGPDGTLRLIRNHEVRNGPGNRALAVPYVGTPYDALAGGGTLTIDFNPATMRPVREFVSICGTHTNCAGGLAFRNAGWLTCEETTVDARNGFLQPHGYTFLVPAQGFAPASPVALKAMGRFAKEAAVAEERTGIVYQTEDAGNSSGFYRFVPSDPDDLVRGGRLQMLKVSGEPLFAGNAGQTVGKLIGCEWVEIDSPDPNLATGQPSCFAQGRGQGGAAFNRLEGVYRGEGNSIYFVSTSGGNAQRGQLWQYRPASPDLGTLTLVFESPSSAVLDSPDNICVTPSGAILFCEDDASGDNDTHPLAPGFRNVDRLIGLSRDGVPFEFAVNIHNESEFTGACFSPDGSILFVNLQGGASALSGMTCAITGPWRKGPL
jgi:secreted PhoX family phosphatase